MNETHLKLNETYIKSLYCSCSESSLSRILKDMRTVDNIYSDDDDDRTEVISKLVDDIAKGAISYDLIDDKYISNLFSIDEDSEISSIKTSIQYLYAFQISKRQELPSLNELGHFYEIMGTPFFWGLNIPNDYIGTMIDKLKQNFESLILKKVTSFASNKEIFYNDLSSLLQTNYGNADTLSLINQFTDGSYVSLPHYVSAISLICKIHGYETEWQRLYDALRIFPLQGALMFNLHTPEQCIQIVNAQRGKLCERVTIKLMQNIMFRVMYTCSEMLSDNTKAKLLTDSEHQKASAYLESYTNSRYEYAKEFISQSLNVLGWDDTVTWIIGLINRIKDKELRFIEHQKAVADFFYETLKDILTQHIAENNVERGFLLESDNFDNIIFYLSILNDFQGLECSEELGADLIRKLIKSTYANYFVLPAADKQGFDKMRSVYRFLPPNWHITMDSLKPFRHSSVGFKVDNEKVYSTYRGDEFWFSVLFLQFESLIPDFYPNTSSCALIPSSSDVDSLSTPMTTISDSLKALVEYVLNLVLISHDSGKFFEPLYIVELMVSQVLLECKDWFEMKLIKEHSNLLEVLRIFSANKGIFSDEVKSELTQRIKKEWTYEKEITAVYNKNIISYLDHYISSL